MIKLQLPQGVVAAFTNQNINSDQLFPEEQIISRNYETKRKIDFNRGRYCAHHCLSVFDQKQAIKRDIAGAPVWPEGFTGSISHSQRLAGAILARKCDYLAVGLDIERIGRITPDLWSVLFTNTEKDLLRSQSEELQPLFSTAMFSMKEAYYKMQFQLTHRGMEFDDMEVTYEKDCFFVREKTIMLCQIHLGSITAKYEIIGDKVISYILLTKRGTE